jgi:hypothetical protein
LPDLRESFASFSIKEELENAFISLIKFSPLPWMLPGLIEIRKRNIYSLQAHKDDIQFLNFDLSGYSCLCLDQTLQFQTRT